MPVQELEPTVTQASLAVRWADASVMLLVLKTTPTRQDFVRWVEPWFEHHFFAAQRRGILIIDLRGIHQSPDASFLLETLRWCLTHLITINRLSFGQVYITDSGLIQSTIGAILAKIPLVAPFSLCTSVEAAVQSAEERLQRHSMTCNGAQVRQVIEESFP